MGGEHSLSADRVTVTPVQCHSEDMWRYAVIPPPVKHKHTMLYFSLSRSLILMENPHVEVYTQLSGVKVN